MHKKRTEDTSNLLVEAQAELARLDRRRAELKRRIAVFQEELKESFSENGSDAINVDVAESSAEYQTPSVTLYSPEQDKIALIRSLFRGREDVYPKRFESIRSGKSGYQPHCANEWVRGLCDKPRTKCTDCANRVFVPIKDETIRCHLLGQQPGSKRDFTIGVYPLLPDNSCWFVAVDFDKQSWQQDVFAFAETCRLLEVPVAIERSRSGTGAHVWIFFGEQIPAALARDLASMSLTETMERRPEIGLDSYDRLFPNQNTVPEGGFGNLIALPLQKKPRTQGNSVFVDQNLHPYEDQWAFLSTLKRMSRADVESLTNTAGKKGRILGIKLAIPGEDDEEPWRAPPSGHRKPNEIKGTLPAHVELILANQLYIPKADLPPSLINRLVRMAAFQNPEFYKRQAMRLATHATPRIIGCAEEFPLHLGLPRGCLEEALSCFEELGVGVALHDKRYPGYTIKVNFTGSLREEQKQAVRTILEHETGVLAATTAFGKTVIAAYVIAERNVNTLILVHNRELLDQWLAQLKAFLDVSPNEIGQIRGGRKKPRGVIDVAMIQSLSRHGTVEDIVGDYGHIVVDECHHLPARSFENVIKQSKAKYVTGLSATVNRKDGHHPIIFMNCGPVRYRVSAKTEAARRPFHHRVFVRYTNATLSTKPSEGEEETPAIHELYRELIHNESRNEMIRNDVVACIHHGRSPVVLTERREHLDLLEKLLRPNTDNLIVLKGGMGVKERRRQFELLESVPDDQPRVLLATGRYLGEGFDDARLDTLLLTLPVSWRGTIAQYAGRLHRMHEGKQEVHIYDYVERCISLATKMHQRRCAGYRELGYTIEYETDANLLHRTKLQNRPTAVKRVRE